MILLQSIDTHWREHLSALDYLRQGIHLRGYAQKQPKQEYKREAFELFGQLLDAVKNEVTKTLMMVRIDSGDQMQQAAQAIEERAEQISNVTYSAPDETGQPQTVAADLAGLQQAFVRWDAMNLAPAGVARSSSNATANSPECDERTKRASARFVLVPSEYRLISLKDVYACEPATTGPPPNFSPLRVFASALPKRAYEKPTAKTSRCFCWTKAPAWRVCSQATVFVPRLCRCAVST